MKYTLIGFERKFGSFDNDKGTISYDNYYLTVIREVTVDEMKLNKYGGVVTTVKIPFRKIAAYVKSPDELSKYIGSEIEIETEIDINGKANHIIFIK